MDYTCDVETQTKERLTGALILVAVLVVVVPEIFSGPSRRAAGGIAPQAQSASDGPPLRSYTMELGADKTGAAADQSVLTPQAQPDVQGDAAAISPPAVSSGTTTESSKVASADPDAAPAAVVPTPAIMAGWWVQLGSFSQRDNAQRLVRELQKAGFSAQLSAMNTNGKELFRVRAGPAADKASAQALQGRLAATGRRGSLVAP